MKFTIKILPFLCWLSFSPLAFAEEKVLSLSQKMEEKKYYYSALNEFFKETYTREATKDDLARLEGLLYYTGIELLEDYEPWMLAKFPTSSTRFILGRQAMQAKKYKKALELFTLVHPDHRYFSEAKLLEAQIHSQQGEIKQEFEAFESCLAFAEKKEGQSGEEKIKRYYRMVYEICLVNKARHFYKVKDFQGALDAYNKIPKVSYKWPYILLEKAWVYYQMGDFNRALGLLVTYKSPLMDTYFFPEAEYLTALAYFRLCLFDDSMVVVNQYYQSYRPRFQALEGVLRQNRSSQNYFYNMMFKETEDLKEHSEFVKQIMTRMKKQIRFSLDFNNIHRINQEMKRVYETEKGKERNDLMHHLNFVKENMTAKINYNAKTDIFQFLETVPFYSSELFKLNLEIISRKKELVYGNKKLISDRSRGSYSNVQRSRFEQFWQFKGEFWADELGDYSLGLKSNCEVIKKEIEKVTGE